MRVDYDKLLKAGNAAQLEKLKENEHKRGFDDSDIHHASHRIDHGRAELGSLLYNGFYGNPKTKSEMDYSAIRKKAANIANFAHMIILKYDREIK